MHAKAGVPLFLTAVRVLLAPVLVLLALYDADRSFFGACLILAFLSDVFDGVIARRLGVATSTLRRLDSFADTLFYLTAGFAAWHLYPVALQEHVVALLVLVVLEFTRYLVDIIKFRREASYHMWSSKLWGVFLFLGFFSVLVLHEAGLVVALAIYIGIAADIEGLAITIILRRWVADVPTFVHALRMRRADGRTT